MKRLAETNRHMPKLHIKKDDMVLVLSGDDKGKKARVLEVITKEAKVFVEGVNMISRHTKPQTNKTNVKGGIIKKEAAMHASKLMLIDAKSGLPTRVKRKQGEEPTAAPTKTKTRKSKAAKTA